MKVKVWIFAVLCLALSAFAAPPPKPKMVRWLDYTEALEKAKTSKKLIFVDLYADWCVPCRIMEANTYSDPTVASLLNTRFISTKLDVDSQDTITCDGKRKTVQRCYFDVWNLSVLPAFVLIAPKGLSIMTIKDSFTAEEMKYLLYQILEKEKEWISK
jgi:thiol-disulfide isomerase/thioredoxin